MDDDRAFDLAVVEIQQLNDELIQEFLRTRVRPRDIPLAQAQAQAEELPQVQGETPGGPYAVGP